MSLSSLEPYGKRTTAGAAAEAEERWHVKLSADDVKMMTVEQLDDAYRLSIVDSDTEVWKPGMARWQPLGVVAGLDADEPEVTKVGPSPHDATPRAPIGTPKTPPLRAVPAPREAAPPPPSRSIPPPPRLVVVAKPPPAAPPAPSSIAPSIAVNSPPRAAAVAAPPVQWTAPSLPPVAHSTAPVRRAAPRSSGWSRFSLSVAFLASVILCAYRNDVLLDGARKLHVERRYLELEQRYFGGPAFGMVRAVERTVGTPTAAAAPPQATHPEPARPSAPPAPSVTAAQLSELPLAADEPTPPKVLERRAAPKAQRESTPSLAPAPRTKAKRSAASRASMYDPLNPAL